MLNQNFELRETLCQILLSAFKEKDYSSFIKILNDDHPLISDYMKTSLKTLNEFKNNIFNNQYHNGFIEGNNNFIKVIKRIAFGFRSFCRFKARIMICKGLIKLNKKVANT
ncbi:MAG: transposase [Bacilli bacterium]|nr:transposase [Bacilli bacterium]